MQTAVWNKSAIFPSLSFQWYTWAFALLVMVLSLVGLPYGGNDWRVAFAPAARHWWDAPWQETMPYPPWAALLLAPLSVFSDAVGTALVNSFSVLLLARLIRRWDGAA